MHRNHLLAEVVELYTHAGTSYERARRWRFDAVIGNGPTDAAGNLVITAALAAIFADTANHTAIGLWLIVINSLSLLRLAIFFMHPRADQARRRRLQRLFSLSLVVHAAMWASSFLLFAPPDSIAHRSAVLIWLAGCAAWVVAAYTPLIEAVLGFLLVQLLPVSLVLLLSGDRFWQLVSVACLVFLPTMAMVALRTHAQLMRGTVTQFEKEELAAALEQEKKVVLELNRDLAADLARRERVEADLREAKTRAERLANELEKLSSLDGLTGIANRRRFDQTLAREWSRAQRGQQPLALILCDIDYFKQYNDHYGHQAGDACLRQLAKLLEGSLHRGGDLAARYGGEEFAILLPGLNVEHAAGLAETIRENLFDLGLPHAQSAVAAVLTASFGVAAIVPGNDHSPDQLVQQADQALYAAKAAGRNRVQRAGERSLAPLDTQEGLLH
ncbi:MAG: diguanylate cyclase [Gammaproteobacteria bacterium]